MWSEFAICSKIIRKGHIMKSLKRWVCIIVGLALIFTMSTATTFAASKPAKVTKETIKSTTYNSITIGWKKVKGASGYEVYRATSKSGSYKLVKTINKAKTVSFKDKGLKSNKTYYYKVRAFKKSGSKKTKGKYSAVFSGKTKKCMSVSKKSVSIKQNKSTKVTVTFKQSGTVYWESDDPDIATCSWGDFNNNKAPLTIKAGKPGTTYITITNTHNKEKIKIKVKVKSIYNTVISTKPPSISVVEGEKKTLIIHTDKGEEVSFDTNNDNVDCEWGDWFPDNNDTYFYVTGEEEGDSVITIYDSHNTDVETKIKVTVKPEVDIHVPDNYEYIDYSEDGEIDQVVDIRNVKVSTKVKDPDTGTWAILVDVSCILETDNIAFPGMDSICMIPVSLQQNGKVIYTGDIVKTGLSEGSYFSAQAGFVDVKKGEYDFVIG